jgi:hypothetical protein
MPEALTIGYFLEDIAQEQFITALVQRAAGELHVAVTPDVRNATGGKGRALTELEHYLRDARAGQVPLHPILVVVIDGNCDTYQARRRQIEQVKERTGYPGTIVCAVPDPHIERWYLADGEGFRLAIEGSQPPALPAYKCERRRYKQALRQAFTSAGLDPQLGGAEYAREIVECISLYRAGKTDAAFKHFMDDLCAALSPFARQVPG